MKNIELNSTQKIRPWLAALALCLALPAAPVRAHHTFQSEFDMQRGPGTMSGKVVKLDWSNPHIFLYLEVQGDHGKKEVWALEGSSPSALYRVGWRKDRFHFGQEVTVTGYKARNGAKMGSLDTVTFPDGSKLEDGYKPQ